MPEINYVNPQINNINEKEISIQVGLNGFSFLIRSLKDETCLAFKMYPFRNLSLIDEMIRKTEDIILADKHLNGTFRNTTVTYHSQKASIVPNAFFDANSLKKLFEFSHSMDDLDELHFFNLSELEAKCVFSVHNYLSDLFNRKFGVVNYSHQTNGLSEIASKITTPNTDTVLLGINHAYFDLMIFEGKLLTIYNSYNYTNELDFIYFVIYASKQLKIDLSTIDIHLVGELAKDNKICLELRKHVKSINYPKAERKPLCKNLNIDIPNQFYSLF